MFYILHKLDVVIKKKIHKEIGLSQKSNLNHGERNRYLIS